jgi:hypothetical protein
MTIGKRGSGPDLGGGATLGRPIRTGGKPCSGGTSKSTRKTQNSP